MNKLSHNIVIFIWLLFFASTSFSQEHFSFNGAGIKKQSVSFKLLSNLTVFPIEVNGSKLNFILDSGVGTTILFNLNSKDSLMLRDVKKIKLQGLGSEDPVDAILSKNNTFKINKITGHNQKLYVIFDDSFDLSSKLGITIHGIIGYEILKDFVVNINYSTKRLSFYNPLKYEYKSCNKCELFPLEFNKKKPYINVGVMLKGNSNKITPVKLLIDSGGSDALWLFENSHADIVTPEKYFYDFLGEGLSGAIYGKRAIVDALHIGQFILKSPTVSYPDAEAVEHARKMLDRNGSLGANILKRFSVTFDYKNKRMILKKGSSFKTPFRYNMSGIELVYNGKVLVKEHDQKSTSFSLIGNSEATKQSKIYLDYRYKYTFKSSYKIHKLRFDSPAYRAGLQENDLVIKINGKYTYEMQLEEIVAKFYEKENKKISLLIERNGQNYSYKFYLENILK